MSKILIDSSAWIEYFAGTQKGAAVQKALRNEPTIYITGFIAAEVCAKFLRDQQPVEGAVQALRSLTQVMNFDLSLGEVAAKLYVSRRKNHNKFGLADAHVLAVARSVGAKVITCDLDFEGLPDSFVIK